MVQVVTRGEKTQSVLGDQRVQGGQEDWDIDGGGKGRLGDGG